MKNRIKTYKTSLKTSNIVSVDVNDVFEEITDENKELREQIKLLVEFKQFFDKIIDKLKSYLNEYELSELKTFDHKLNRVFGSDITLNEKIDIKVETDCLRNQETNEDGSDDSNDEDFSPMIKNHLRTGRKGSNRCLTNKIVNKSKRLLTENRNNYFSKKSSEIANNVKPEKPRKPYDRRESSKHRQKFYKVCDYQNCGKVFRLRHSYWDQRYEVHQLIDEQCTRTVHRCDWPGCDFVAVRARKYQQHVNSHEGSFTLFILSQLDV